MLQSTLINRVDSRMDDNNALNSRITTPGVLLHHCSIYLIAGDDSQQ